MKYMERVNYIDNMPCEVFGALLSNKQEVKNSLKRYNEIMACANNQRPSDSRGNTRKILNRDYIMNGIDRNESVLTTKMVSLSILFANPTDEPQRFIEICEIFTKVNEKTGSKTVDYESIAKLYETTTEQVRCNIAFEELKQNSLIKKLSK